MTEKDAWNQFFQSGYVLDYLQYKSIRKAMNATENAKGGNNEVQDRSSDIEGTEHRRKR